MNALITVSCTAKQHAAESSAAERNGACAHLIQVWEINIPLHKASACLGLVGREGVDQVARQGVCAGHAHALG